MLGNWSFGDYFKKEICSWAWELLTKEYGLEKDRLYVTYFGGSTEAGLEPDDECKSIWINDLGLDPSKVIPGSMKDNFWEMGDTGPCGPCSEIHYDRIGGRNAAHLVNMDDPDVLEIWNLVFIQFNREQDSSLKPLPKKHVDTGMGFERITSVIQNKRSNYDTDIFVPIFEATAQMTGCRPYTGKVGAEDVDGIDMAYRVIADHARTLTVALSDGGRPDNVGRGYVLRRILRRAVRYGTEKLGAKPGMFASLVPVVVNILGGFFPEMKKDPQTVIDIINEEETQFLKTLSRGRRLLERTITKLGDNKVLPGDIAWRLYDTYGFPLDLTHLMVEEKNLSIDMVGYEAAKAKAQASSQSKITSQHSPIELNVHSIAELKEQLKVPLTNDDPKYDYKANSDEPNAEYIFPPCSGRILALRKDASFVDSVDSGTECGVILDTTCFYAEAGGQIFDTGFMTKDGQSGDDEDCEFEVRDVKCQGGYIVHLGNVASGCLKIGDVMKLQIDQHRRKSVMNNHTGTHVLNYALRAVLKTENEQRGSLVAPDRLRFDFTNKGPMSPIQVKETEQTSQKVIEKNEIVYAADATLPKAKEIKGLRAVFDEAYPDPVRVVSIGVPIDSLLTNPESDAGLETSVEFCGGTHLKRSGHIGDFVISSEEAISKGIRRIIALTGPEATRAIKKAALFQTEADKIAEQVKSATNAIEQKKLVKSIVELIEEVSQSNISYWKKDELRNNLNASKKKLDDADRASKAANLNQVTETVKALAESLKDTPFVVKALEAGSNAKALDAAVKQIKSISPKTAAMFISCDDKKIICLASVPSELISSSGLKANEWVQQLSPIINGKGGGKPESAQASGTNVTAITAAVEAAQAFAKLKIN